MFSEAAEEFLDEFVDELLILIVNEMVDAFADVGIELEPCWVAVA